MKKKVLLVALVLVLLVSSVTLAPHIAYALPYNTYTSGAGGEIVPTQTAYSPKSKVALSGSGAFNSPQDMVFDQADSLLYVADTGNKRVAVVDLQSNLKLEIGKGDLGEPIGLSMLNDSLYVADKSKKCIFVFDKNTGALLDTITKPESPLVGENTPFVPTKLEVDTRGNIYVISEGCVNGIMQLNAEGEFIAYVGANKTPAGFTTFLQQLFFSDNQVKAFLSTPRSPTNINMDSKGLLYTVTQGANGDSIKKLNSVGTAIMSPPSTDSTVAVAIDNEDNIFGVDSDGYITVFDSYGSMLFMFGGKGSDERLGNLYDPVAIAVMQNGDLLVLDKMYNMVVRYTRTDFANLVFTAVSYYKDGLYLQGEEHWKEILRQNSNFIVAYNALAKANMKRGDYDTALEQFKLAESYEGYSDAYWQIRNDWLQDNLGWVLLIVAIVAVVVVVIKFVNKKKPQVFAPLVNVGQKITGSTLVKQLLHIKRFLKSPQDAVYEVKYHNGASVLSASILYLWFVVLQVLSILVSGFLFSNRTVYDTNAGELILYSTLPLFLLVIANYFVSTVTDGEGKLKYCYVTFIYALSPYLLMALPVFIISNFLTYNEEIVYTFLCIVMYGWSGINVFLTIGELHDYNFGQTVKNVLLTIFAFAMALLFIVVLRMLAAQLFGYFVQVFVELFS